MTETLRSTALPLEWRLHALLTACNSVPVFGVAIVVAYVSLLGGVVTGGAFWVIGGAFVWAILGGAVFCLLVASNLTKQRSKARVAALGIYAVMALLLVAIANSPTQHSLVDQRDLNALHNPGRPLSQVLFTALLWTGGKALWASELVLPYLNVIAIGHLALRWRSFSSSRQRSP